MTRVGIVCALVALGSLFGANAASARQSDPVVGPPAPKPQPTPKMMLSQYVWDFGNADFGGTLERSFLVRNEGTADLRILNLTGTCACTVADISRALVPPGESAEITVQFDTRARQGSINTSVRIESNDPNRSSTVFTVIGTVQRPIEVEPESLSLSSLDRSAAMSGSVTIRYNTPAPYTPHIKPPGSHLVLAELKELSAGRTYQLLIKAGAKPPIGLTRTEVVIETGYEALPTIRVPVYINIQPRVQASPTAIFIPPKVTKKSYRQIRVQYFGSRRDFRVTRVESSHKAVSAELRTRVALPVRRARRRSIGPTLQQIVALRIPPADKLPGLLEIRIHTNDPDFGMITVTITKDAGQYRRLMKRPTQDDAQPASSQPANGP